MENAEKQLVAFLKQVLCEAVGESAVSFGSQCGSRVLGLTCTYIPGQVLICRFSLYKAVPTQPRTAATQGNLHE